MKFSQIVRQALALLQESGRVSYGALKLEFELDDDRLETLKEELLFAHPQIKDHDGRGLTWVEDAEPGDKLKLIAGSPVTGTLADAPTLEPERRQLTVMFCDLVGSTALSQKLDAEDLRELMGAYQKTAGVIIDRYEGHVAQYLGDGLMVYFGWPHAHEDDAARAVRAGIELVEEVKGVSGSEPLRVRIGIATGPVVVGQTGAGDASIPKAAVGETPNLAARLQGLAQPDEIVIAPATQRLVGGAFDYDDLGEQVLKGITAPVRAWRVTRESSVVGRFEAQTAGGLTPFVGRESEIALLLERWDEVKDGEGQVVLLSGEPGIGKSRITQVLQTQIADEPHRALQFQCSPFYTNTAFHPIVGYLRRAAGVSADRDVGSNLDRLEAFLHQGIDNVANVAPLIGTLLALPVDRYPRTRLSPQGQKAQIFEALVEHTIALTREYPALLIFEDVHWADPTTLDLLGAIIHQNQNARAFLVITHRPEFDPPWRNYAHVTSHSLNRLSRRQGERLVAKLIGDFPLSEAVVGQVISKTDGVPLFIEELTKTLIERDDDDRQPASSSKSSEEIPATLRDSLMARLDRLGSAKEVAQFGACIGREFSYPLLAAVVADESAVLNNALKRLCDAGLLFRHEHDSHATYSFKHALIQEAAYQSLLKSHRRGVHKKIATALDSGLGGSVAAELIAHHYSEAGLVEQAIPYWRQAGEHAVERSAELEAIGHFAKAVDLLHTLPVNRERLQQELALQIAMGTAQMVTRGPGAPEVGQTIKRADVLSQQLGNNRERVDVLLGLWMYNLASYAEETTPLSSRQMAEQVLQLAQKENDVPSLLKAHMALGSTLFDHGELRSASEHIGRCTALYDKHLHHRPTAFLAGADVGVWARFYAGMTHWLLGRPDDAVAATHSAVTLARDLGHPPSEARSLAFAAWVDNWRGDLSAAREHAEAATALSHKHGFDMISGLSAISLCATFAAHGHVENQVDKAEDALATFRNIGMEGYMPYLLAELAQIHVIAGQAEAALSVIDEAFGVMGRRGEKWNEAELYRIKGDARLQLLKDDTDKTAYRETEGCFEQALEIARAQGAKSWELRAAMSLSRLWQRQGRRAETHELLAALCGWFTQGFETRDLREANALLHELDA